MRHTASAQHFGAFPPPSQPMNTSKGKTMSSNTVLRRMRFIVTPLCFLTTAFGQTAQQPQPLSLQQKLQVMQQAAAKSQQ